MMAQPFPYTYYACDCFDNSASTTAAAASKRASQPPRPSAEEEEEEERTFDPRSPRANYSLYPIEHLLYCADCRQVRCPRCVTEEILCWYCPSCQIEAGSSAVRGDANRCQRNCFNCPICVSPLITQSLKPSVPSHLQSEEEPALPDGPFFLQCPYCQWTTLDIGIQFDKPNGVFKQLSEIKNGGDHLPSLRERDKERTKKIDLLDKRRHPEDYRREDRIKSDEAKALYPDDQPAVEPPEHDELFGNLAAFYRSQLAKEKSSNDHSRHSKYLSRLLNTTGKPQRPDTKPRPMAEARNISEGLSLLSVKSEMATIERMKELGWDGSLSQEQRLAQPVTTARFHSALRPIPTLLRTKRTKRCRTCRQILSRPENKVTSTRYKIKLLALNQIPRIFIRALSAPPPSAAWSSTNATPPFNYESIAPLVPTQFLLTLINPLFDPIRVTLATPATTPGRIQSKVTILCPQFEVGANTDVWDEALGEGPAKRRPVSMVGEGQPDAGGMVQAEAGKIWEKGRNWTSVIVEVVPGSSEISKLAQFGAKERGESQNAKLNLNGCYDSDEEEDDDALEEDEDVLEIPVFVRIEYDTDPAGEDRDGGATRSDVNKGKERREEAFWCVLGCGRIAQLCEK